MATILIVDDEAKIRNIYRQFLSQQGYKVIEASNAVFARDLLLKESIDIMLLDIHMPEIDGTVLHGLSKTFHKNTKIIVCSVYPLEEQKQRIDNADDYFDKSQDSKILLEKVKRLVNSGGA